MQVFRNASISDVDRFATGRVIQLRGWLDGKAAKELVYTIPVSAGFPAIEGLFSEVKAAYPDVGSGYFGNVYDERDGVTPLNGGRLKLQHRGAESSEVGWTGALTRRTRRRGRGPGRR